jgi:hypothetical protein
MRDFSVKRLAIITDMIFIVFALIFVSFNIMQGASTVACSGYALQLTALSENQTIIGGPNMDPFSDHGSDLCQLLNIPGTVSVSIRNMGSPVGVRNPADPLMYNILIILILIIFLLYKIGSLIYLYTWERN